MDRRGTPGLARPDGRPVASGSACTEVTDAATTAVGALADPPRSPEPHQDACTALTSSGADLGDLALRFSEIQHGLDLCQARAAIDGGWESLYLHQGARRTTRCRRDGNRPQHCPSEYC